MKGDDTPRKTHPYRVRRDANFSPIVPPNILRGNNDNPSVQQCRWRDTMASSNGSNFHVTGPLWRESIGHQWIPLKNATDAELWCFCCAWTNGWTHNRDAGDLRRHHVNYDVTVTENGYVAFKPSDFIFLSNGNIHSGRRHLIIFVSTSWIILTPFGSDYAWHQP